MEEEASVPTGPGQGPDWNDPSGETIVAHPNEIWVRDGFKHTEKPRIINNIARWCSPKSKVRAGMQEYLRVDDDDNDLWGD